MKDILFLAAAITLFAYYTAFGVNTNTMYNVEKTNEICRILTKTKINKKDNTVC